MKISSLISRFLASSSPAIFGLLEARFVLWFCCSCQSVVMTQTLTRFGLRNGRIGYNDGCNPVMASKQASIHILIPMAHLQRSAQAMAALAPGNEWVTAAKSIVNGQCGRVIFPRGTRSCSGGCCPSNDFLLVHVLICFKGSPKNSISGGFAYVDPRLECNRCCTSTLAGDISEFIAHHSCTPQQSTTSSI